MMSLWIVTATEKSMPLRDSATANEATESTNTTRGSKLSSVPKSTSVWSVHFRHFTDNNRFEILSRTVKLEKS
jgi:hypothetical protein